MSVTPRADAADCKTLLFAAVETPTPDQYRARVQDFAAAQQACEAEGLERQAIFALVRRATFLWLLTDLQPSLTLSGQAEARSRAIGDQSLLALALVAKSYSLLDLGRYADAAAAIEGALPALEHEPAFGLDRDTALTQASMIYTALGQTDKAAALEQRRKPYVSSNPIEDESSATADDAAALASLRVGVETFFQRNPHLRFRNGIWENDPIVKAQLAVILVAEDFRRPAFFAIALVSMADLWISGGNREVDSALARAYALEALAALSDVQVLNVEWRVSRTLAQSFFDDSPQQAVWWGKQAVNALQKIRSYQSSLSAADQRTLLDAKRSTYEWLVDALIDQGRLAEAQQVLAMLREEEYFDYIRRSEADDLRKTTIDLRAHERSWQAELSKLRLAISDSRTAESRKALRTAAASWKGKAQQHTDSSSQEAEALALRSSIQHELSALGKGFVVVQYLVTDERLRALVTSASGQWTRDIPVQRRVLDRMILGFRQAVVDSRQPVLPAAQSLYGLLIEPLAGLLYETGAKHLLLGLDANLRYLPFAALHDGKRWLVETYTLTGYTPAAGLGTAAEEPINEWRIAALGVSEASGDFPALPAVEGELNSVARDEERNRGHGPLPGRIRLNREFDREALLASLKDGFPIVHIASHFRFLPGTEADSFLLLGGAGRLSLADLRAPGYALKGVNLLALSACNTAMGADDPAAGSEIEGFSVLAQRQGAQNVLATLWAIADESTGTFMAQFYQERMSSPSAAALRATQISMARSPDLSHPFYWAGFTLSGLPH